jgi:hypothetical protein
MSSSMRAWHEFIDAGSGMAVGNGLQGCLEIGVWLDAVEFAGLDESIRLRTIPATKPT